MTSLYRRMMVAIWSALVMVGLSWSAYVYWDTSQKQDAALDAEMRQVANIVEIEADRSSVDAVVSSLVDIDGDGDEDMIVIIRGTDGKVLFNSSKTVLPAAPRDGMQTIELGAESYRMLSTVSGERRILVAQPLSSRRDISATAAWDAVVPAIILMPVLGIIIAVVIRSLLLPLRRIAVAVSRRSPTDQTPLSSERVPKEIRPFIREIQRLLNRQAQAILHEQRFITDAAHALRTPLTAIQLQADIVGGSPDPDENQRRLLALRSGIGRAVQLVHQLLAIARESRSSAPSSRIQVDPVLLELTQAYEPVASSRGNHLVADVHSGAEVMASAGDLSLAAGNLLDNALRYTPPGGKVELRSRREGKAVRIEVADEGPGLAEEELEKAFERFHRGAGDLTEGSGLGLAAVRGVCHRLGGRAWLENRRDRTGLLACVLLPESAA